MDLFDRLSLRARQSASYSALLGYFSDSRSLQIKNLLLVEAAAGLYLDLTRAPLYRNVPRTHPATGEITTRRTVSQGQRWRWIILRASAFWHPVGDVLGLPFGLDLATGIERKF